MPIEAAAHVLLQGDVGTVVAGVTLVYQRFFDVVEQTVHRTECAAMDAHRGIEAILIVAVNAQVQVVRELIHISSQEVMSLREAEILVGQFAVGIAEEIGLSPDKLLQGRLFSYGDAQRYRLGVNHDQIPVNMPRCPMHSYHRDGKMRVDGNNGSTKGYSPNSIGEWNTKTLHESFSDVCGESMRYNPYEEREDNCFYQPGNLYRLMSEEKKALLIENTAEDMKPVTVNIKYRHAAHCYLADKDYGMRLASAMNLDKAEVERLAAMSEKERLEATVTR